MSSTSGSETSWWVVIPHILNIHCWFLSEVSSCCITYTFEGDQQQHSWAALDRVLRGNLFKDLQVLGASAWCGVFPATVWWDLCHSLGNWGRSSWLDRKNMFSFFLKKKSLNQRNHLYLSRFHRWIHRRDQRNLVQLQPLRVRNGCTRHNCASKLRTYEIRYQAARASVHILYKVTCFSSARLWVIGP